MSQGCLLTLTNALSTSQKINSPSTTQKAISDLLSIPISEYLGSYLRFSLLDKRPSLATLFLGQLGLALFFGHYGPIEITEFSPNPALQPPSPSASQNQVLLTSFSLSLVWVILPQTSLSIIRVIQTQMPSTRNFSMKKNAKVNNERNFYPKIKWNINKNGLKSIILFIHTVICTY